MPSSRLYKDARSFRQEVFQDLSAALAHPDDLAKVPAMLADAQEKQVATGGALSELIAMHCSQLRTGLEELAAALADVDVVKKRLVIIQELCKRSDVLEPAESAHAATLSTVQTNILRTIGGVDNIHRFPARAQDAAALLRDVDSDPAALLDVFHDLSALLATQSVAHRLIETMKAHASVSQSEEMAKVETYFGQVQRVSAAFTEKLLSYFDSVLHSARAHPRHLVMALRVVLNQEAAWALVVAKGGEKAAAAPEGGNPWGVLYRDEAVKRIERSAERAMRPALLEADRVFGQWMHVHGRTAASFFSDAQARRRTADAAAAATTNPDSPTAPDTARAAAAAAPGHRARAMRGSVAAVQDRVVAKLIGGVTRAPIQLTGMAAPVEAAPEAEQWLEGVQVDEEAVDAMHATLAHADEIVAALVEVYDEALPCFPPALNPVQVQAKATSHAASTMLDALGQAAASFDNAGLLALLGWMDSYRSTLVGLGLPDEAIHISTAPRVRTPRGEAVPLHGVDVARLVYIDRIRKQLGKAFSNLAESDLLQEPEPDGEGRLWTPGVIEMFRFLTQQVELAASVRDAEVVRNVASVALQVMQSYQGLVLSAMVDGDAKRGGKRLDFNMLVAVVNNSLIAYDQARDLASVIDAAIRANNDRGGEGDGDGGGRRRSTDSDGGLLNDSEIHVEMEECNRGFLNVSKVALDKVVQSIFEDQGTADVLRALYKGPDWCGGVTTHSVLLTLADYLSDLESWLDPPFYRRACQKCLRDTVHEFRAAFMRQMPANSLREAEMERLDTDISDLRDFFLRYLPPEKVDAGLEALEAVQKLCQCESADEFEETFGFMLMDSSCSVRPKDVARVCAKRPDIDGADAATIEAGCERQYQQWLAGQQGRGGGSPRPRDGGDGGDRDGGALARLYQRVVKAVGADAGE